MTFLKALYVLIFALPDIIELIRRIEECNKQRNTDRKTKEDLQKITQAFKDRDEKALRDVFNN